MTRISKRSLKKHHSYQTQKKCFTFLGVSVILFCVANLFLGSEYAPEDQSNKLLSKLLLKHRTSNKYQQQQVAECRKFPVSIQKDEELHQIEHPVSAYQHWEENILIEEQDSIPRKFIQVPSLYATTEMREYLGNYGSELMTTEQAGSIGSHIFLNKQTHEPVSDACDGATSTASDDTILKLETINIMIASFRDGTMCKNTLHGLFARAKYPQRVRVTIVDQVLPPESEYYNEQDNDHPCTVPTVPCEEDPTQVLCRYSKYIDPLQFNALDSSGPVTSRHLSHRLYRGEYFVLQCDSHVEFTKHWDTEIIEEWKSTNNEMAVLTVYPDQAYEVNATTGERLTRKRAIMCSTMFENGGDEVGMHLRHDQEPCSLPDFQDMQQQLQPLWAAGFSFARGHFVVNVPYDLYLPNIFQGEESNIGIRAFTYGYDLYAPSRPIVYHYYSPKKNKKTKSGKKVAVKKVKRLKFWDLPTYDDDTALQAMQRLNSIIELGMNDNLVFPMDLKEYGIGKVRSTDKYYKTFGFHRDTASMEANLCMFVASKEMNLRFLPALRENRMGIDYRHENLINWEFKDVWPCPDYWWHDDSCPSSKSESSDD